MDPTNWKEQKRSGGTIHVPKWMSSTARPYKMRWREKEGATLLYIAVVYYFCLFCFIWFQCCLEFNICDIKGGCIGYTRRGKLGQASVQVYKCVDRHRPSVEFQYDGLIKREERRRSEGLLNEVDGNWWWYCVDTWWYCVDTSTTRA